MFELKNNSDGAIHFRRPDLKLNFDLLPGKSVVITGRQAMAVELYMNDMDITVSPSSASEPDEETQSVEVDREAAVRGVAISGLVDFNSQSIRPENRKDFYNNAEAEPESDEEKTKVAADNARLAKSYEAKSKKALDSVEDEKAKSKAEENIKKEGEQAEKASKDAPVTKAVDLGELVPMAGSEPGKGDKEKAEKAKK